VCRQMALLSNGVLWPSQRFVETYHAHRYGNERAATSRPAAPASGGRRFLPALPEDKQFEPMRALTDFPSSALRAIQSRTRGYSADDAMSPVSASARSAWGDYGYSLIRSDVEEDQPDPKSLPNMPNAVLGVRQRTLTHFPNLMNPFDLEDQYQGPMAWVDSTWFHVLSGLVIFANALIIGLETDVETPFWFWAEQSLLTFFALELIVRLLRHGCHFFRHEDDWVWNIFDFSIVMSGVFDQWLMPCFKQMSHSLLDNKSRKDHMSVLFMLMRMGRLLRIVRLFRLVRIVRPLYELAQGVLEALQGMFWVLIFMVMTLYAVAILCTRLIGHGGILPSDLAEDDEIQQIQAMFNTVDESMFTLFGTMSSWSLLKFVPLFEEMPILRPLFVLFYVYSAWALLAVMTGVVSENMIAIREQMMREDERKEELRKSMITDTLIELFRKADTDNSGTVSREEFDAMLRKPDLIRKITKNTHMRVQDLHDLFDWIDHDGGGTITIDEFMMGFKWVNEPLRAKSLVKLQERLASDLKKLEATVTQVVEKRVNEVQKLVSQPLRKVHAITEQMQNLDVHFSDMRSGLKEQVLSLPTPQELREVESRLSAKLASVFERLDEIEQAAQR